MQTSLDPLAALSATQPQSGTAAGSTELGRNEFLQLLVTKLENQDPFNPAEDTEFIHQLATFSSLEQLISANTNLKELALGQETLVNSQALNLLGKEALLASESTLELTDGVPEELVYELPVGVSNATLTIRDSTGKPVRNLDLTGEPGVRQNLEWDGRDEDGVPLIDGEYSFSVTAEDASGESVNVSFFKALRIDGVKFVNGSIALISGDQEIPMELIVEYRA